MQYVALLPEEVVQLQRSRHWGVLVVPALTFAALVLLNGVLGRILVFLASLVGLEAADLPLRGIKTGLFVLAFAYLVQAAIACLQSKITITSRRVILDTWLIGPQSSEVFLSQVASVSVGDTALGRYLGYGFVVITTVGGGRLVLSSLAGSLEVHTAILRLVTDLQSNDPLPSDNEAAA